MKTTSGSSLPFRVGAWLSSDQAFLERWLAEIIDQTHAAERPLHPVIADFRVEPNEHVYPMVPSGKGLHEMELGTLA